jgi:hypothetical protein
MRVGEGQDGASKLCIRIDPETAALEFLNDARDTVAATGNTSSVSMRNTRRLQRARRTIGGRSAGLTLSNNVATSGTPGRYKDSTRVRSESEGKPRKFPHRIALRTLAA